MYTSGETGAVLNELVIPVAIIVKAVALGHPEAAVHGDVHLIVKISDVLAGFAVAVQGELDPATWHVTVPIPT